LKQLGFKTSLQYHINRIMSYAVASKDTFLSSRTADRPLMIREHRFSLSLYCYVARIQSTTETLGAENR
jgi:hypothetical protein